MKVKRLKKKVIKKFNWINLLIAAFCVGTGYLIVRASSAVDNQKRMTSIDQISESATRIANSFELYNQKKFLDEPRPAKDNGG